MFNLILINTHLQLQRQTGQKTLHAVLFILSFIKPMTEAQAERQFYKTNTNWIFQLPYFSFYFVVRDSCYIVYAVGFSRIVDNNDAYIYILLVEIITTFNTEQGAFETLTDLLGMYARLQSI